MAGMEKSKIGYYFSKAFIQYDEDDVVLFEFEGQKKKIKSHKSILSENSPIFLVMFGDNWTDNGSIKLQDQVEFNQYETFKLFVELLYEIQHVESLTVKQATDVYFYSDKYQVETLMEQIKIFLNKTMESRIATEPISLTELEQQLSFAELYGLEDFKNKLNSVTLVLNDENVHDYFALAKKYEMKELKNQIIKYISKQQPNDTWSLELSKLVVELFQKEKAELRAFYQTLQCYYTGNLCTDCPRDCCRACIEIGQRI